MGVIKSGKEKGLAKYLSSSPDTKMFEQENKYCSKQSLEEYIDF